MSARRVQCNACGKAQRAYRSATWNHAGYLFTNHNDAKGRLCAGSGKSPSKVRRAHHAFVGVLAGPNAGNGICARCGEPHERTSPVAGEDGA